LSGVKPIPTGTRITGNWAWAEAASRLLGRDEREAVLGDLIESGEGAWAALFAVLGLILRRETEVFKTWRPWIAALALSVPCSFLLMGASVSVTRSLQDIFAPSHGLVASSSASLWLPAISQVLLLVGWSWTGGFAVGSLSRRTLWVSAVSCLLPCLFCLSRFRVESLSPPCLFLFLLPAVWGASNGLRLGRIKRPSAILLAVAVTMLTIPTLHIHGEPWWNPPRWLIALTLTWPAWYLAANSANTRQKPDTHNHERWTGRQETP
jgi:hypothetical protein